jgi:BON domain-containing protein
MKRSLCGLALAFAVSTFAQQQYPTNPPPYTTPPTFPQDQAPRQMPPDTKAPPPSELSTAQVEQKIQDKLSSEPALSKAKLGVKADQQSVTLTGTVDTDTQHDVALRIARSYAGDRKIVDRIEVRQQS